MARAWLGLGGNVGDVVAAMAFALRNLDTDRFVHVAKVSPVYKTPPWGLIDQAWFHNCCAEVESGLSPEALLVLCREQERLGKRQRSVRWGPRTIDIDVLAYEGVEQVDDNLTLPHPRMSQRSFVIVPLADIAPDLVIEGQTMTQHARAQVADELDRLDLPTDWWRQDGNQSAR
ncbi:MAG: 2-amino-4-hydroxy-6-hydroxymethyldihydropteridine diphosphokinase [Ahrensia sp.]|nr:2-amino-4-hydroxy-6-hydroxymethyldihydropteridine diphosphokinase [Ahrensia sp.]